MEANSRLEFDLISVKDKKQGGFSGHFEQFPNTFSEGKDKRELCLNLLSAVHDIFIHNSNQVKNDGKDKWGFNYYGLEIIKEQGVWIVNSPILDLSGYGYTMNEAIESFQVTLEEFIRYKKEMITK